MEMEVQGILDKFVDHNKLWGALKALAAIQTSLHRLNERAGSDLVKWGR